MGYFTIYNESDYDVHMGDIIDNLKSFNDKELMELMEYLEPLVNKDTLKRESFEIKNLDDYHNYFRYYPFTYCYHICCDIMSLLYLKEDFPLWKKSPCLLKKSYARS